MTSTDYPPTPPITATEWTESPIRTVDSGAPANERTTIQVSAAWFPDGDHDVRLFATWTRDGSERDLVFDLAGARHLLVALAETVGWLDGRDHATTGGC